MWKRPFTHYTRSFWLFTTFLLPLLILWQLYPTPIAYAQKCQTTYTVFSGDSLIKIGRQFGVSVSTLKEANNIPPNSNIIFVGQQLCIPSSTPPINLQMTGQSIGLSISRDVALGDLDGDGDLDAFVVNVGPNKVWLNDGLGFFIDSGQILGFTDSTSVALGDIDGDGDLDAAIGNQGSNQLWLNQQGQFTLLAQTFPNIPTNDVALGDLNQDGFLDLVFANSGKNEVWLNGITAVSTTQSILQNEALFEIWEQEEEWGEQSSGGVTLAHMNDDNLLDIIFVPDGVWLNNANTSSTPFSPTIQFNSALNKPEAKVVVANFDNDPNNHPDIIIGYQDLYVYKNFDPNSINQLTEQIIETDSRKVNQYFALAAGDLDGDLDPDLLAVDSGPDRNTVLRNDGQFDLIVADFFVSNFSNSVAFGDLNNDGLLDVFLANGSRLSATPAANNVLLNTTLPLRRSAHDPPNANQDKFLKLILANLDDDPALEELTISQDTAQLFSGALFIQNDNFNPFLPDPFNLTIGDREIADVATGFLNDDTYLDVVVLYAGELSEDRAQIVNNSEIGIFLNKGGEQWEETILSLTFPNRTNGGPTVATMGSIGLADLNIDGHIDIFLGSSCLSSASCNRANYIFINNQDGTFPETPTSTIGFGATHAVGLGDLDGDNDVDAVIGNYWNQPNKLFLNNGDGVFTDSGLSLGSASSMDIVVADLDGNGTLDILETRFRSGLTVWWNQGALRFVEESLWQGEGDQVYVETADLNGNGRFDILISTDQAFILLNNQGNRQFSTHRLSDNRANNPTSAIADLDADGDLDILLSYRDGLDIHTNDRQGLYDNSTITFSQPFLEPKVLPTTQITETVIPISYTVTTANGQPVPQIRAYYSLNGGGQWAEAIPQSISDTIGIQPGPNVFNWDTFKSGFFGESQTVLLRLVAQTQSAQAGEIGTYLSPNQTATSFLAASSSVTSPPFRVRGTQIQVNSDATNAPAQDASVYLMRDGFQQAQLMGSNDVANVTDESGILSGRGSIRQGDQLFAMQPISQEFRIPPQLIFGGAGTAETTLTTPITAGLTAEFWLHPRSSQATPLVLGNALTLSYATLTETTALTLTLPGQTLTHQLPLHNGLAHHLALSWNGETGEAALIVNGETAVSSTIPLEEATPLSFTSLQIGQDFAGVIDEIRLWNTVRTAEQISTTRFTTPLAPTDSLIGYWPITADDKEEIADHSGNNQPLTLAGETAVGYKPLYTVYHTSGVIDATTPLTQTINGVQFTEVISPGLQQLTVSANNPLILFDIDVSLEWDARNDANFLRDLEDSFRDASALLYDVTNGQVALGQINLFHDKAYWGVADVVIYADNALRPSAAIGGVVNERTQEPTLPDMEEASYLPGQIRMGTSWDPYGENTADLGLEWSRALAHELAHYFFFLPDNYLGIAQGDHDHEELDHDHEDVEEDHDHEDGDSNHSRGGIFRRIVCPGSFMTTTSDPSFSEFLTDDEWLGACLETIAQITTGRNDWETITQFYPQLNAPTQTIDGPTDLPLAVTYMLPWSFADDALPFPARNFDVRAADGSQERLRLPSAQAYLIKQHRGVTETTNVDFTNDQLILLGTPVGGGDRLDVRGAEEGDQLCLFDGIQGYAGCISSIDGNTVAIQAAPIWPALGWQPQINSRAVDATTVAITITQPLTEGDQLAVQLFPIHYGSVSGNAPVHIFTDTSTDIHAVTLQMVLPAYETAVRVWTLPNGTCDDQVDTANEQAQSQNDNHEPWKCTREALFTTRLNPTDWNPATNLPQTSQNRSLQYAPFTFGPDSTVVGGPDSTVVGGTSLVANPDSTVVGGPDSTVVGGPDSTVVGGTGRILLGNPDSTVVGGALLLGNPDSTVVGGPDSTVVGGAAGILLGNPDSTVVGGTSLLGNPDSTVVGGGSKEATAPILSADAKVVIYSAEGLFADNGVESIELLANVPHRDTHRWLLPVGQAYRVTLRDIDAPRFISFSYLQRDVPDGFEQSLAVYFLPNDGDQWEKQRESSGFVENLIVSQLQSEDGIYAVMATVELPQLVGGEWGLIPYLMPDCRPAEEGLAAIWERVDRLFEAENPFMIDTAVLESLPNQDEIVRDLQPNSYYWVRLTPGDPITPFLAPPQRLPNGEFRTCSPTEPAESDGNQ